MNSQDLEAVFPMVVHAIQTVLTQQNIRNLQVSEIRFQVSQRHGMTIEVGSDCPPGMVPRYECKELPGGGVRCEVVCKPA